MYIIELFEEEQTSSVLVIYPGRFQPWHKGHKAVYDHLTRQFGRDNVFIATSNKVDPPRSPFSFGEKTQFMQLTGIPMDRVVETRDPYRALEIVQNYNPKTTRLIFAVSEKDMAQDPRFKFGYKKDGSPTYLQALPKDSSNMLPFEQHGYVMTVPTFEFTILGNKMEGATEIRNLFARSNDEAQRAIIKDLFGSYDTEVHSLMKNKIGLNENYEYRPPGGSAKQTQAVLNKIQQADPNRNKFIWKRPNQFGGSFTAQELTSRGFKFSERYNVWGGTQAMWDRLMPKESNLNRSTATPQELMKKFNLSTEELISQLKLGIKTELEHTKDPKVAYEIALDHLSENPKYYTLLTQAGLEGKSIREFSPPGRGDGGDQDPYGTPKPEHYSRSIDFFSRFEADHFDEEEMNDATGEFKGYWNYDGKMKQIAYFKFDNPKRTGSNHPGTGWYYEPQNENINEFAFGDGSGGDEDDGKSYLMQLAQDLYNALYGPIKDPQKVKNIKAKIEMAGGRVDISFNDDGSFNVVMYHPKYFKQGYLISLVGKDGSLNEFAPANAGGPKGPKDYGQPNSSRYIGGNKFVVGTTNNYVLTATVDKWGLEWDEDDNIWFLDSPGAVYIADASEGEIELPTPQEQRNQIHDLVTNYLNARNLAELQKVAAYYGHSNDGEMSTSLNELAPGSSQGMAEDAAGVGVVAKNKKMAQDPRYSMSITKDVQPGQDLKNLRALRLRK
jgi:hypothetical protein